MVATPKIDLIAIVGPTASGKSALAMRVARAFNGEIICADSRTIYKGMDIGTAKPSRADRRAVKHWGLDLIKPGEAYSAAQFKEYALQKIDDIQSRNKLPIIAGGTGLYVDGILFDFNFIESTDRQRDSLEGLTISELQAIIHANAYKMPENDKNRRYLIRTIERRGRLGLRTKNLKPGTLLVGLLPADEELRNSINERAEIIFDTGVIKETKYLIKKYGQSAVQSTGGIVYLICLRMLGGHLDEETAIDMFKRRDWQYARRQKTWFKRNKFIQWFNDSESAFASVKTSLNTDIGA